MVCPVCGTEVDDGADYCPKCGVALTYKAAAENSKKDGSAKGGPVVTLIYAVVSIAAVAVFCWVILFWHESQVRSEPKIIAPGVSLSRIMSS